MKNKNLIIVIFLIAISMMSIAYSSFVTSIKLNTKSTISGEWNIKIIKVEVKDKSNEADPGTLNFTDTTATFDAKLNKPSDFITYEITIKNQGTIDAKLDNITITGEKDEPKEILYENTSPANNLGKGEQTSFTITVKYDDTADKIPELKTKTITSTIIYTQQ